MPPRSADRLGLLHQLLQDLVAQARAYETVLRGNGQALSAVGALRELAETALTEAGDLAAEADTADSALTARERQVLELVARGLASKQVAYELRISERTVQFHLRSIFDKLDAQSRTEAVVKALERGWLALPR